jgi:hypothetical protein
LFYDSKSEEEMEPLDKLDPLCLKTEDVEADKVIRTLEAPTQEGLNKVSYFKTFNDYLFYDVESKEVSDVLIPSCYDKDNDFVDNFDEFIHVGKHGWDMFRCDDNPMYDIDGPFQRLPLHLSPEVTNNFDIWQQEPGLI